MTPALTEPLMTVEQVATYLNVKPKRVYELPIRKRHVGRSVRYDPADIRRYLAEQDIREPSRKVG